MKYRLDGREKLLALGTYPQVTLKQARQKRDDARAEIAEGIDPVLARKGRRNGEGPDGPTFGAVAAEWVARSQA